MDRLAAPSVRAVPFLQELIVIEAGSDRDIETVFATFAQRGALGG